MLGSLRAMVENVERELKYYKDAVDEQTKVIAQLHRGYVLPGESTYIHPADFSEILNDFVQSRDSLWMSLDERGPRDTFVIRGVRYKQSTHMPQITTKFR